jgi:transcription elongation factor SPT4
MSDPIPRDFHNLRACILCHLIKHADQFEKNGCENCEEFLGFRHNRDMVMSCTSANFSGMIALCQPEDSWVARWQRLSKKVRGMYAIDVSGKLPAGIASELKSSSSYIDGS